ncbi:hypothetical protein ACFYW6_34110 [Streptomyces sp. NPDC002659]
MNGITAGVGGVYLLTSSMLVTALGALLATVLAVLHVTFGR